MAVAYQTKFGSLASYDKGRVEPITDDVRNYAFSNCFDVASKSKPYERVVFGQNQIYVMEVARAEGSSPWYTCAHDEFALCMDKEVFVHLAKLDRPCTSPEQNGAVLAPDDTIGAHLGWVRARRGHQVLLPAGAAYRFEASRPAVVVVQKCKGELSVERWADICQLS